MDIISLATTGIACVVIEIEFMSSGFNLPCQSINLDTDETTIKWLAIIEVIIFIIVKVETSLPVCS